MARIRTIKPEFWTDETIVELPFEYRLLFIGLWNFVDDEGYVEYRPKQLKMKVFPGDDIDIRAGIESLIAHSLIDVYEAQIEGRRVEILHISKWSRHQVINRATKSKYNGIYLERRDAGTLFSEDSVSDHGGLTRERKGREGKGKEGVELVGNPHQSDADDANDPPIQLCGFRHPPERGCQGCARQRKQAESDATRERMQAASTLGKVRARETQDAIDACELCDESGRSPNGMPCHHVESAPMPEGLRELIKTTKGDS